MTPEYIYAISNPHMPGLLKIGRTADVAERVAQLSSHSGVPAPFKIEHVVAVQDSAYAERDAHDVLARYRISFSREFFRCSLDEAKAAMAIALKVDGVRAAEACRFADWMRANSESQELPTIISWLEGTKAKDVIAALRREAA